MKNRLLFHQDVSLLVQSGLCPHKEYSRSYSRTLKAFQRLAKKAEDHLFPFLSDPFDDSHSFKEIAEHFKKMKIILIIGSPSSTTTLRALTSLLQSWVWIEGGGPRLCFLDEVDPEVFWEIMTIANPLKTGVMVFSRSGENEGTLLQVMRCLEYWQGLIKPDELANHFLIVTSQSDKPNRLHQMASFFNFICLDFPTLFFSGSACFSKPFLIPLRACGFDLAKFYQGAALSCIQFFKGQSPILEGAALLSVAYHLYGIKIQAYQTSIVAFEPIVTWMKEVSTSLFNKAPFVCSLAQDEQERCFFTLFFERHLARERLNPDFWKGIPSLKDLAQKPLLAHVHTTHLAVCQKAIQEKNFLRVMTINSLNEEVLGALMMSHILETLLVEEMFAFG